jgi:2-polyprenyl-6-methoxyphenol hydroxylase-like FAD-dependent oxidoreductase
MEIAIFGAGIAGLMSAITLRVRGHKCRIYERSSQAQDAGMGFIVVPEAIEFLHGFGVDLEPVGTRLEGYLCRDAAGQILQEQGIPAGARGILRRDLIAALTGGLNGDKTVVFAALKNLEFNTDESVAWAQVSSDSGDARIQADLYVSAEGVNSRARQSIFPDWPVMPYQVQEMVGMMRCERAAAWAGQNLNKFHADEGGIALGILPVGAQHVVWYLQFDSKRFPLSVAATYGSGPPAAEARRAFVEELVGTWAHPVPSLIAATDFLRVHLWRPVETELIPQFHRENLVLAGDAAHPLSPFTSQGVSSAIGDAVALAEALDEAGKGKTTLDSALSGYSAERHAKCAPFVAKGRELTRDFLAPLAAKSLLLPIA